VAALNTEWTQREECVKGDDRSLREDEKQELWSINSIFNCSYS